MIRKFAAIAALGALLAAPGVAVAQDAAGVPQESAFVFNSLLFLVGGFLVMWMAAGFTMLETGFVPHTECRRPVPQGCRHLRDFEPGVFHFGVQPHVSGRRLDH